MSDTSQPGPDDFVIYDTFTKDGPIVKNAPPVPEPTEAELEEARQLLAWANEQAAKAKG